MVPLEGVQPRVNLRDEAALHIVVHAKITLYQVSKLRHDFVRVLFYQALKPAERIELIEVLFEFCIKICEDVEVLFENLNNFFLATSLCELRLSLEVGILT